MEKKVIRVGSIGIGSISRGVHLPGIAKSPDLQLVAVCDINPDALKYAQETYGIDEAHCFTDYHDLINCPDVDAIDISTPNDVHFPMAMAAVEAGKPFAVEKPMTMNAEEADILQKAVAEKNIPNMVCFSYRFKAAARYARDLVQQGALGKIYHVDMQYYQAWGLPWCHTPQVWRFIKSRTGTGALGDLGRHALDLVRFVTGQEYTKVVGHTGNFISQREKLDGTGMGVSDVDDFSNYMAELSDGGAATFRITRFGTGRGNFQTMEVYGSEGALEYRLDHFENNPTGEDEIYICISKPHADSHVFAKLPIPDKYKTDQMQSFADIINGKGDGLAATVLDGDVNMHAVDAVVDSAEKGVWINL